MLVFGCSNNIIFVVGGSPRGSFHLSATNGVRNVSVSTPQSDGSALLVDVGTTFNYSLSVLRNELVVGTRARTFAERVRDLGVIG